MGFQGGDHCVRPTAKFGKAIALAIVCEFCRKLPFARNLRLRAPQRCNAERSDAQRKFFTTLPIPLFLQRHRCDALPCFSASPVVIFYITHIALRPLLPFSFRHNGLLYKTTRNLPRVTTQRCRHWQREMAIANANANAAMRCTKISGAQDMTCSNLEQTLSSAQVPSTSEFD